MVNLKQFTQGLIVFVGASAMNLASADILLDHSLGAAQPSASDYEHDVFAKASVGYGLDQWQFRLGYAYLGEFELDMEESSHPDHPPSIRMRAPYLEVARVFPTQVVDWEVGLGLSQVTVESRLFGRMVDRRKELAPFLELGVVKNFNELFAVKAGYNYFHDVAGSDVSALSVGFRFSF